MNSHLSSYLAPIGVDPSKLIDLLTSPYVPCWTFGEELASPLEPAGASGSRAASQAARYVRETLAALRKGVLKSGPPGLQHRRIRPLSQGHCPELPTKRWKESQDIHFLCAIRQRKTRPRQKFRASIADRAGQTS
jgi:hypothetical protein